MDFRWWIAGENPILQETVCLPNWSWFGRHHCVKLIGCCDVLSTWHGAGSEETKKANMEFACLISTSDATTLCCEFPYCPLRCICCCGGGISRNLIFVPLGQICGPTDCETAVCKGKTRSSNSDGSDLGPLKGTAVLPNLTLLLLFLIRLAHLKCAVLNTPSW